MSAPPLTLDFDPSLTLQDLQGGDWGHPNFQSHLVITCHALRRKPLCEFTPEDLRIMIGQNIGIRYLLPIALRILEEKPLAEGDHYQGDLLVAVLSCDLETHKDWRVFAERLETIAVIAATALAFEGGDATDEIRDSILRGRARVAALREKMAIALPVPASVTPRATDH